MLNKIFSYFTKCAIASEKNKYLIQTIEVKKLINGLLENRELKEITIINVRNKKINLFENNFQ